MAGEVNGLYAETLFGPSDKVERTILRLQTFAPPEGYYLAFSGGKDSCVLLDIARRSGCRYDAHYSMTCLDPPELVSFIRREHPDVIFEKPKMPIWRLIIHEGMPPTRIIRYCCRYLKENGGAGRFVLTGVRAQESARRSRRSMVEGCYKVAGRGKKYLHPLLDWSKDDVWEYIRSRGIPYCSLYDEGFHRIGCIACPMATERRRRADLDRWPGYRTAFLRTFEKLLAKPCGDGSPRLVRTGEQTPEGILEWWLRAAPRKSKDDIVDLWS